MALHKNFPQSPYEILDPAIRWFPADENLREKGYEKLLPPLVAELRKKVRDWRLSGYDGASETSKTLLKWWFLTDHPTETSNGDLPARQEYFFFNTILPSARRWKRLFGCMKSPRRETRTHLCNLIARGRFQPVCLARLGRDMS